MFKKLVEFFTGPWRYDERNPYRRYCKECGTEQDAYSDGFGQQWETMLPVHTCSRKH